MKTADVIETVRWSLNKCRHRVPVRTHDCIMSDDFDIKNPVIQAAKQHFQHFDSGGMIVLAGPTGIGKTVAAVFFSCMRVSVSPAHREWERQRVRPPDLWYVESDLILANAFNKSYVPPGCHDKTRVADLKGVMVIDDMGTEALKKGWTMDRYYIFLNNRYSNMLPTIATTNIHDRDEFYERYGGRARSRFVEWCRWVWVDGDDLRTKEKVNGN